jgi:hypothetical protein
MVTISQMINIFCTPIFPFEGFDGAVLCLHLGVGSIKRGLLNMHLSLFIFRPTGLTCKQKSANMVPHLEQHKEWECSNYLDRFSSFSMQLSWKWRILRLVQTRLMYSIRSSFCWWREISSRVSKAPSLCSARVNKSSSVIRTIVDSFFATETERQKYYFRFYQLF